MGYCHACSRMHDWLPIAAGVLDWWFLCQGTSFLWRGIVGLESNTLLGIVLLFLPFSFRLFFIFKLRIFKIVSFFLSDSLLQLKMVQNMINQLIHLEVSRLPSFIRSRTNEIVRPITRSFRFSKGKKVYCFVLQQNRLETPFMGA